MTTCPNCNARCNPLRFLLVSKWSPYICRDCKARSDFSLRHNILLGLVTGLLFGLLSFFLVKRIGALGMIVSLILIILIVPFYQYYFMELKITDKEK